MEACVEYGCCMAGGEQQEDAEAQEDNEDVTTKEDAKPDSLVSAYWETIGTCSHNWHCQHTSCNCQEMHWQ